MTGDDPAFPARKADALPLSYIGLCASHFRLTVKDGFQRALSFSVRICATLTSVRSDLTTGAAGGIRTLNLLLTKQLLCQLSYGGMKAGDGLKNGVLCQGTTSPAARPCFAAQVSSIWQKHGEAFRASRFSFFRLPRVVGCYIYFFD